MIRLRLLIKVSQKDWKDIRGNRQILVPMIALPIFFGVLYPFLLIGIPLSNGSLSSYGSIGGLLGYLDYVSVILRSLFVVIPLMITMTIASASWAEEKEKKTAESLFLLPLTDTELFTAKVLTSFIPGILITWACAAASMTLIDAMVYPYIMVLLLPDFGWLFVLFVFTPILAVFSIYMGVWVSYRARDAKSAQQIGSSVVFIFLPILITGFIGTGLANFLIYLLSAVLGALDIALIYLSPRIFSRERMIARF
jgi:hypothetical protein